MIFHGSPHFCPICRFNRSLKKSTCPAPLVTMRWSSSQLKFTWSLEQPFSFQVQKLGWILMFLIFGVIFIFAPIFMIIIGIANRQNCPANKFIPIWLTTYGSILLATVLINFMLFGIFCRERSGRTLQTVIYVVVFLFLFAWTIAGKINDLELVYVSPFVAFNVELLT